MTTFLFWNLNKKRIERVVADLVQMHEVDVLILTECGSPADALQVRLNQGKVQRLERSYGVCKEILILTRFSAKFIEPIFESQRVTIRHLTLPRKPSLLLAAVHQPSKLYWSNASQSFECQELSSTIRSVEREVGHSRTLLVGDLNMNPFEDGLVAANGLNAAMARMIAERGSRTVQGKPYPFFYNPMWSHFGDGIEGPSGTFYRAGSEQITLFWNMFDQVLLRPDLLGIFKNEDLRILSDCGSKSLLTAAGRPDTKGASDHLPLLFRLDL